jgi:hypothetical protein
MSNTESTWTQDTPTPDMEIFIGASDFIDTSAHATFGSAGAGLFAMTVPASTASTLFASLSDMMKKTGIGLPKDPRGYSGIPPLTASQMPTLGHGISPTNLPPAKGMYVTSVDLVYTVAGSALTLATIGLTDTTFANNVAPAVTNRIAVGANGMPTAVQVQPYKFNVPVPLTQQVFPVTTGTQTILNVNLSAGTGACTFYGAVLHCTYNLN